MPDLIEVDLSEPGDGPPPRSRRIRIESRWAWLVVGLGLGLSASLLFTISAGRGGADNGGESTTTLEALPDRAGMSGEVPGFPDGLNVLVSPGEGRALEVITWPNLGEALSRSVPAGGRDLSGTPLFDSSGHFVAIPSLAPPGFILQAGRPNTLEIVATGINSFVWHDAEPDLAWSKLSEDELEVWVAEDAGEGALIVRAVDVGEAVAGFGDWGFAITEASGLIDGELTFRTHLLDPDGEESAAIEGRLIASHNSGLLLLEDEGEVRVTSWSDPNESIEIPSQNLSEPVLSAEFSPQGDKVALVGLTDVTVIDFGALEFSAHAVRTTGAIPSWSSDGRFLLVPGFRGISVIDTTLGTITPILQSEIAMAVAAVPIGS